MAAPGWMAILIIVVMIGVTNVEGKSLLKRSAEPSLWDDSGDDESTSLDILGHHHNDNNLDDYTDAEKVGMVLALLVGLVLVSLVLVCVFCGKCIAIAGLCCMCMKCCRDPERNTTNIIYQPMQTPVYPPGELVDPRGNKSMQPPVYPPSEYVDPRGHQQQINGGWNPQPPKY